MHIGIIGGIGPASTELYYRELVKQYQVANRSLELTIVHADIHELTKNLLLNDKQKQANIFISYINKLAKCGATHILIPSLAGHFCLTELETHSPLPIISALDTLRHYVQENAISKVGVLGTLPTMQTGIFGCFAEGSYIAPTPHEQIIVADTYRRFARNGYASANDKAAIFSIGQKLVHENKAEVILLAGTDFFLAFNNENCGFHAVDCAQLHIASVVNLAKKSTFE